jgi:hypothetical protein
MTLKFSPSNHRYFLDKRPIPGVTTLLGKGLPKPAIPYWASKTVAEYVIDNPAGVDQLRSMGRGPAVAALKQIPWQKRDEAAVRGTDVHRHAEALVHGQDADCPEHLLGYVQGYADFLDKHNVNGMLTERPVASRTHWYAGTFDLIAEIDGVVWGLDNKASKGVYGSTALQLAAYFNAEFYCDETGDEQPIPKVERMGVIHIQDGMSHLYPVKDPESAWRDVLHVFWTAKAIDRIDAQISEPLHLEEAS